MTDIDNQVNLKRLIALAEDIGDLIFELETSSQLTKEEAELISVELDQIFAKHLQQIKNPEYS